MTLDSPEIENEILNMDAFLNDAERTCEELLTYVRHLQLILNVTIEYKYYLLFCGLFQGKRNVVKNWPKYEAAFMKLVQADGELGIKRLIQTIALYFVKRDPSQQKYLGTFMKMLYDQSVFSD